MIVAVTIENAHLYGDIIPSIFRLRYQSFKVRQDYEVPHFRKMEYDAYDTPATTYLAWRDGQGAVRGCTRLFPTTLPYMIEDIWPESVTDISLPKAYDVWESSRFCIDKHLPVEQRRLIHGELLCAFQEFCLAMGVRWMIGVMNPAIWRAVFIRAGWPIKFLGPEISLSPRERIAAGKMIVSGSVLDNLRRRFGIAEPVLTPIHESLFREVADA